MRTFKKFLLDFLSGSKVLRDIRKSEEDKAAFARYLDCLAYCHQYETGRQANDVSFLLSDGMEVNEAIKFLDFDNQMDITGVNFLTKVKRYLKKTFK